VIRSIDKQSYPVTDGQNLHPSFLFTFFLPFTLSASSRSLDSLSQISTRVHPADPASVPDTFGWCIFHDASGNARLVASYSYQWIRHSRFLYSMDVRWYSLRLTKIIALRHCTVNLIVISDNALQFFNVCPKRKRTISTQN